MFNLYQTLLLFGILLSLEASRIFGLHLEYKPYSKQAGLLVFFPPTPVQVSNSHKSLLIIPEMQGSDIYQPDETLCSGFFY